VFSSSFLAARSRSTCARGHHTGHPNHSTAAMTLVLRPFFTRFGEQLHRHRPAPPPPHTPSCAHTEQTPHTCASSSGMPCSACSCFLTPNVTLGGEGQWWTGVEERDVVGDEGQEIHEQPRFTPSHPRCRTYRGRGALEGDQGAHQLIDTGVRNRQPGRGSQGGHTSQPLPAVVQGLVRVQCHADLIPYSQQQQASLRGLDRHLPNQLIWKQHARCAPACTESTDPCIRRAKRQRQHDSVVVWAVGNRITSPTHSAGTRASVNEST
jgi:hypothetical protein